MPSFRAIYQLARMYAVIFCAKMVRAVSRLQNGEMQIAFESAASHQIELNLHWTREMMLPCCHPRPTQCLSNSRFSFVRFFKWLPLIHRRAPNTMWKRTLQMTSNLPSKAELISIWTIARTHAESGSNYRLSFYMKNDVILCGFAIILTVHPM